MVLIGCVLYKEKLTRWQLAAIALAVLGVGHSKHRRHCPWKRCMWRWPILFVLFMRRALKTDHLGGFWWDLFLILPAACYLGFVYSDSMAVLGCCG